MIKYKGKVYKSQSDITSERSAWYQMVIYMQSESYSFGEVWELVKEISPSHIFIIHDKDNTEDGEIKKPHAHIIYQLNSNQLWTTQIKTFENVGLSWNNIQPVVVPKKAIRYLIHLDDPDKFQYDAKDVLGNIEIQPYLKGESTENELLYIMNEIRRPDSTIRSLFDLTMFCIKYGYVGTLKQYQYLFTRIIAECAKVQ